MKSMKIGGGPFRREATPSVVFKWIRETLFTTDVVDGIEEFCEVSFKSSYQHIDASDSRIKEDSKAVDKIFSNSQPLSSCSGSHIDFYRSCR